MFSQYLNAPLLDFLSSWSDTHLGLSVVLALLFVWIALYYAKRALMLFRVKPELDTLEWTEMQARGLVGSEPGWRDYYRGELESAFAFALLAVILYWLGAYTIVLALGFAVLAVAAFIVIVVLWLISFPVRPLRKIVGAPW